MHAIACPRADLGAIRPLQPWPLSHVALPQHHQHHQHVKPHTQQGQPARPDEYCEPASQREADEQAARTRAGTMRCDVQRPRNAAAAGSVRHGLHPRLALSSSSPRAQNGGGPYPRRRQRQSPARASPPAPPAQAVAALPCQSASLVLLLLPPLLPQQPHPALVHGCTADDGSTGGVMGREGGEGGRQGSRVMKRQAGCRGLGSSASSMARQAACWDSGFEGTNLKVSGLEPVTARRTTTALYAWQQQQQQQ